jgi:hypothetical protein
MVIFVSCVLQINCVIYKLCGPNKKIYATSDENLFDSLGVEDGCTMCVVVGSRSVVYADAFISYDWGVDNKQRLFVSNVNKELQLRKLDTWFDEDRSRNNSSTSKTDGIDNSKSFVAFITQSYIDKVSGFEDRESCKVSFLYALKKFGPKKLIPVIMESAVGHPSEWPGLIGEVFCNQEFIDMSEDVEMIGGDFYHDYAEKCDDLHNKILNVISHQWWNPSIDEQERRKDVDDSNDDEYYDNYDDHDEFDFWLTGKQEN